MIAKVGKIFLRSAFQKPSRFPSSYYQTKFLSNLTPSSQCLLTVATPLSSSKSANAFSSPTTSKSNLQRPNLSRREKQVPAQFDLRQKEKGRYRNHAEYVSLYLLMRSKARFCSTVARPPFWHASCDAGRIIRRQQNV